MGKTCTLLQLLFVAFAANSLHFASLNLFLLAQFQVLQQEVVDVEALDDVDCCGKTLLDRLTMPVIFPDGYALHFRVTNFHHKNVLVPELFHF